MLVATPGRLYVFLGGPGLQGAFSGYSSRSLGISRLAANVASPNGPGYSRLCLFEIALAGSRSSTVRQPLQVTSADVDAELDNFVELPPVAGGGAGSLAVHTPPGGGAADGFAWMVEPGVYAGEAMATQFDE